MNFSQVCIMMIVMMCLVYDILRNIFTMQWTTVLTNYEEGDEIKFFRERVVWEGNEKRFFLIAVESCVLMLAVITLCKA